MRQRPSRCAGMKFICKTFGVLFMLAFLLLPAWTVAISRPTQPLYACGTFAVCAVLYTVIVYLIMGPPKLRLF
jgi:hypothetical protein